MYSSFDFGKSTVFNSTKTNLSKRKTTNMNTQISINIQVVPRKFIMRNSQKYILRKTAINKKFDWLTKYLTSISPKMEAPFRIQTRRIKMQNNIHPIKTQPDQYTQFQQGLIFENSKSANHDVKQRLKQLNTEIYSNQDQNRKIGNKGINVAILTQSNQQKDNRHTDLRKHCKSVEANQLKIKKNQTSNHFRMKKQNQRTINLRKDSKKANNQAKNQANNENRYQRRVFGRMKLNEDINKYSSFQMKQDFDLKPWKISRDLNQQIEMKQNICSGSIYQYKTNVYCSFESSQSFA